MSCINDLAERGIKLISDYVDMCEDEDQRQCLVQVVEGHRDNYKKIDKLLINYITYM